MENMQEKQNSAIRLLEWIGDNVRDWDIISNQITSDLTHEQCLTMMGKLIDNSLYSMALFILLISANDYTMGRAAEKWVNKKVIEEIKSKGAETVFAQFIEIVKEEEKKYKKDHKQMP